MIAQYMYFHILEASWVYTEGFLIDHYKGIKSFHFDQKEEGNFLKFKHYKRIYIFYKSDIK